jgi:hypothetical protein
MSENHFEKAKAQVAYYSVMKERSIAEGVSAVVLAFEDAAMDRGKPLEVSGLAAVLADVSRAIDETPVESYGHCLYNEHAQRMMLTFLKMAERSGASRESLIGPAIAQFGVAYHMLSFAKHGRHTYRVSDGLATQLALTELRGLKCEDLKLPHSSLYLEVPKFLNFKIYNDATGWHDVTGLYITEDNYDSASDPSKKEPDGGRCWRLCVVGASNGNSPERFDDALIYFAIPLVPGWNIDESLKNMGMRALANSAVDPSLAVDFENHLQQWTAIFRWALNVMVYATTPDADHEFIRDNEEAEAIWRRIQKLPKVSKKRDELKSKFKNMDQRPRDFLGRSVRLTAALRSMLDHKNSGHGTQLLVRTLVSGHWMRYATGEGRKERTWKFRSPYWRGPDGAPVAESAEHVLS